MSATPKNDLDQAIAKTLVIEKTLQVNSTSTFTGAITATGGVVGALTGNSTGTHTGDVTGASGMTYILSNTLAYTDTTAKAMFTIPDGAVIVDWIVNVTTLFDSDGTDQVDIGVSGTQEKFAADIDVSTAGLKTSGIVAAEIGGVQSGAQAVTAIYAAGGSAASQGAATIICRYYNPA